MSDAANEVYVRRLLSKGHGYPVYGPKPDNCLPLAYQDRGTSIGDLVIITNDGTIDFLFNICLPSDHPINNGRTPECFEMVELDPSKDMSLMEDWHGIDSSIASSSVQKKSLAAHAAVTAPGTSVGGGACFTFASSSSEFAILHMQDGADRQNLRHLKKFRDQVLRHAKNWYHYANDTLGRETSYNSLYLVTGCDKSESWGIASYSDTSGDSDISLNWTAAPISGGNASYAYSWDTYSPATVRVGPDRFGRGHPGKKNQCIFIRGFKISVREGPLARIFGSVNLVSIPESNAKRFLTDKSGPFAFKPRSPPSQAGHGGSPTSGHHPPSSCSSDDSGLSYDGDSTFDSDSITSEVETDETDDDEPSVNYFPGSSELYHPSMVINNHLLRAFPEIDIAITHDDDWCSVIEKDAEFPNDEELLRQIIRGRRAVIDAEGAFLLSPVDHESLSLNPIVDSFALFPTEDEHISSDCKIAETQRADSLAGSTCTDYSNDSPQPITSETKMASDLPVMDASAVMDVPRRPKSAGNPSTACQLLHCAHSKSMFSDDLDRHPHHQISVDRDAAHIKNHLVPRMYSSSDCDKAAAQCRSVMSNFRFEPSHDESKSYVSQPASEVQRPSSPLMLHVPRLESYSRLIRRDLHQSACIIPSQCRSAISDFRFEPYDLTGQITSDTMYVAACGDFEDIWKGSWEDGVEVHKVAIKVLRPTGITEADRQKNKRLRREIEVWKRLVHENIVPLLGITTDFGPCIGMVSPWMDNGSLNAYLEKMSGTLPVSDRIQLLCDLGAGLAYLHSNSVIHGDLTGANILIDSQGYARLIDFGLSTIKAEFEGTSYYSSTVGGALRWRAPELLSVSEDDVASNLSAACDIYSYESLALQVLSGKVPYQYLRPIIRSTDGYESDSEFLRVPSPQAQSSGCPLDKEGSTARRKPTNKSRIIRSSTLSLVHSVRSGRETALPATRTLNLRTLSCQRWKESINREVSSLAMASHPNIRNIIAVEGADLLCLHLEPILGMSLSNILRRSSLTNDQLSGICSKIVDGLQHLHQLDIIHGNLNSANVLLDTGGCVKLADFGLTAKVECQQSARNEPIDSPYWSAPEFIRCGKYTTAMDIWSLGIISIEMVEKQPPYFDKDPVIARELIAAGGTPTLRDWQALPWELVRFLSSCLVGNDLERATASELCLHEFLADACSTIGLMPLLDVGTVGANLRSESLGSRQCNELSCGSAPPKPTTPPLKQSGVLAALWSRTHPKASRILARPVRRGSPLQSNERAPNGHEGESERSGSREQKDGIIRSPGHHQMRTVAMLHSHSGEIAVGS